MQDELTQQQNNNVLFEFDAYKGKRSFERIGDAFVLVTDIETNISITEEYEHVYNMLQLIFTKPQFEKFQRVYLTGQPIYYDFGEKQMWIKTDKKAYDQVNSEMKLSMIRSRLEDEDSLKTFFSQEQF